MSRRSKTLIFLLLLSLFTYAVQLEGTPDVLDGLAGIKWSSGLVHFLKQNTQGLVILVLTGLFFEWSGLWSEADRKNIQLNIALELLERTISTSSGRSLTEMGLTQAFGAEASRDISTNLFKQGERLEHFQVSIKVFDLPSEYKIEFEYSYVSQQKKILIAVTNNPSHSEAILSTGLVSEAFYSEPGNASVPAKVTRIGIDPKSRAKIDISLSFSEMSAAKKRRLFSGTSLKIPLDSFKIYEGSPSAEDNVANAYRVSYTASQDKRRPHTFWMSDRVMQIDRIVLDLRALEPTIYDEARVYRFLGLSQWSMSSCFENGKCVLDLNTWVAAGEGVFLTWPGSGKM